LSAATAGFYLQNQPRLTGARLGGQRHRFVTIELSRDFLLRHISRGDSAVHEKLEPLLSGRPRAAAVSEPLRLTSEHQQVLQSLRHPPVLAAAQRLWYHAKVLEVASALFYQPSDGEELFCQRQKRLNRERVQKVIAVLKENLAEPPSLEDIGRRTGCSHFHLSRIFTQEVGKTIFQHLRDLRMERAAQLLREGRLNVTQVALEVGYNSASHFSTAFHETFGCCPGLYPLATPAQRLMRHSTS
jgi:AraC-like DNA-binding protein